MKRNIDLTEDMLFSRNVQPRLSEIMRQSITKGWRILGWRFEKLKSDESCIPLQEQIIPLGNKEDRQFIAECKEMDSEYYCDCCGAYLLRKPWIIDGHYTLCTRCHNQMEKEYNKGFPWQTKPERTRRNILRNF